MKRNIFTLSSALICTLFCTLHFVFSMQEKVVTKVRKQEKEEVSNLILPKLNDTPVSELITLFPEQVEEIEKQIQDTPEPKKEAPKQATKKNDEIDIDNSYVRLAGIFRNNSRYLAVVEKRDKNSGKVIKNIELTEQTEFAGYIVKDIELSKLVLIQGDKELVFQMYKKPKFI